MSAIRRGGMCCTDPSFRLCTNYTQEKSHVGQYPYGLRCRVRDVRAAGPVDQSGGVQGQNVLLLLRWLQGRVREIAGLPSGELRGGSSRRRADADQEMTGAAIRPPSSLALEVSEGER